MGKRLIIAEKPSVARDLASALGKVKKEKEWYENDQYIISSAVGHLVELFMPEDIDKSLGFWRLGSLPIVPEKFQLKPIEKNEKQYKLLAKLIRRKDVDEVVNACDAGREGELIFTYIYELSGAKKPVKRLWMQSMTPGAIRQAFENLRDGEVMQPLQDAARSRSEADWLIGINGTRAITKRMFGSSRGNIATVGRVQTPTLTLVLEREREIRRFQPRAYWRIAGEFSLDAGHYLGYFQRPDFKRREDDPEDRADRLWEKAEAERILAEAQGVETAEVSESTKRTSQISPRLYDLTSLQREANQRYGMPAGVTLRVAQALYEQHKLLTYPRTDSRALPQDYPETVRKTLAALEGDLAAPARKALDEHYVDAKNKRIFNDAQVSDHFAIIPTETQSKRKLSDDERKIYDMVARRFVAAFYPPAVYDVTTRNSVAAGHTFRTTGKVLVEAGWLQVYGTPKDKEQIPPMGAKDGQPPQAGVVKVELEEDTTKPPARYTEATLLSAMEGAGKFVDDDELAEAMKEKGLGTPATRSQIIDHLIRERYIEREGRNLAPTVKAENLIDFLHALKAESLTSPSLTGDWEYKLRQVEEGKLTREAFMGGIVDLTKSLVQRAKDFEEEDAGTRTTDIPSPTDGQPLVETLRSYRSQDGHLTIYKSIGNRKLTEGEVRELLEKRVVGPLDGFRSKAGKPFSALLRLDEETWKVKFDFGNDGEGTEQGDGKPLDFSELRLLGTCPKCEHGVFEAPNAYICQQAGDGSKNCDFRIFRTMLGKTLPPEQIEKLLAEKKTGLIEGFRSKRTKRLFSAFLTLEKSGKLGFEFPPRAATKGAKKAATKKSAAKKAI